MRISTNNMLSTNQKELIQYICLLDSFNDIILEYTNNFYSLHNVTIFKSTDTNISLDLYSQFNHLCDIKKQLHTPFKGGNVNHICAAALNNYIVNGSFLTREQRCVSFDTQTISYIDRYYHGKERSLPNNFGNVIELMQQNNISVDYILYTMENMLTKLINHECIENTLFSFEKVYYNNTKSDRFCHRKVKEVLKIYLQPQNNCTAILKKVYDSIYCVLLKIVTIYFNAKLKTTEEKINTLCEFMNSELCAIMHCEIILAKKYFEKGQNYTFFGKIQMGRVDLIDNIKNMAWDLLHLRMLEHFCITYDASDADIFIPYIFTYDKRLYEIKECYELDALAVCINTQERIPFYSNVNEIQEYITKYYKPLCVMNRMEKQHFVNIPALVNCCEAELRALSNL